MTARVMKWRWLKVIDMEAGILYTYYDEKGISEATWRRYLAKKHGPEAAANMLDPSSERYHSWFYGASEFGRIE